MKVETGDLKKTEEEFPTEIKERMNAVLNVVNSELKSLTLLHLDDTSASGDVIRKRILDTVEDGYLPIPSTFEEYCHHSLLPIGMVAKEEVVRDLSSNVLVGYSLTDAGREYGKMIASFALQFACDNDISMFSILRSTKSRGLSRAPLNRVAVLRESWFPFSGISEPPYHEEWNPESDEVDVGIDTKSIIKATGLEEGVVFKHINELGKMGFLHIYRGEGYGRDKEPDGIFLTGKGRWFVERFANPIESTLEGTYAFPHMKRQHEFLVRNPDIFKGYARKGRDLYKEASPHIL